MKFVFQRVKLTCFMILEIGDWLAWQDSAMERCVGGSSTLIVWITLDIIDGVDIDRFRKNLIFSTELRWRSIFRLTLDTAFWNILIPSCFKSLTICGWEYFACKRAKIRPSTSSLIFFEALIWTVNEHTKR